MLASKIVVISQPMLFPWVGLFEQIRCSSVYVHYDDVQFSKGSFTNRVQIKTAQGSKWLTVPLQGLRLGQAINEVRVADGSEWRTKHLAFLAQAFEHAKFRGDALSLVECVYAQPYTTIDQIAIASIDQVCAYFGLASAADFLCSSRLNAGGRSSGRVLDIVRMLGGSVYVTGHGASRYLDHERFERSGVSVEYMKYDMRPYPQLYGEFTPYVSVLDLIANVGKAGKEYIASGTIPWRRFLASQA